MKATILLGFGFLLACILFLVSCGGERAQHARLDIAATNATDLRLEDTLIQFGESDCRIGVLVPHAIAVHMYWELPVGDIARVQWVAPGGKIQKMSVSVTNVWDPKVPGRLTFEIQTNEVAVRFTELGGR